MHSYIYYEAPLQQQINVNMIIWEQETKEISSLWNTPQIIDLPVYYVANDW